MLFWVGHAWKQLHLLFSDFTSMHHTARKYSLPLALLYSGWSCRQPTLACIFPHSPFHPQATHAPFFISYSFTSSPFIAYILLCISEPTTHLLISDHHQQPNQSGKLCYLFIYLFIISIIISAKKTLRH